MISQLIIQVNWSEYIGSQSAQSDLISTSDLEPEMIHGKNQLFIINHYHKYSCFFPSEFGSDICGENFTLFKKSDQSHQSDIAIQHKFWTLDIKFIIWSAWYHILYVAQLTFCQLLCITAYFS